MRQPARNAALLGAVLALFVGTPILQASGAAAAGTPPSIPPTPRRALGPLSGPFQTADFSCVGAPQSFVVPAGVHAVNVRASGGDGGDAGSSAGGLGGFGTGALSVTPGETLTVDVGCAGAQPLSGALGGAGGWGHGTGGAGGNSTTVGDGGAGGGGSSAVLRSGTPLIVISGGGGSGAAPSGSGGGGDAEQAGADGGAGGPGARGGGGGGGGHFGGGGGGAGATGVDAAGGGGGSPLADAHDAAFSGGSTGAGSGSDGHVTIFMMRGVTAGPYWAGWDIARGAAAAYSSSSPLPDGYVVDGWGGLHPYAQGGVAVPPQPSGASFWRGWDIVRGVALMPDGSGGFTLDGWGGLHPFGLNGQQPPAVHPTAYWAGWDIARGVAVLPDGSGGFVLDGWGGLHPFALGSHAAPALVPGSPYWPGWDIARGVAAPYWDAGAGQSGGYVSDAYGAPHPFGDLAGSPVPVPTGGPYWAGWSIARGVVAFGTGGGFVLDGFGALHPYASAGSPG